MTMYHFTDDVTIDESPQFSELSDWLRGKDLDERQLPASEKEFALNARLKAFVDVKNLFLQAGGNAVSVLEYSTNMPELEKAMADCGRSDEEILITALWPSL